MLREECCWWYSANCCASVANRRSFFLFAGSHPFNFVYAERKASLTFISFFLFAFLKKRLILPFEGQIQMSLAKERDVLKQRPNPVKMKKPKLFKLRLFLRNGARGRTRTGTASLPVDFESTASTSFTTRALRSTVY